jgi:hypothetical protein
VWNLQAVLKSESLRVNRELKTNQQREERQSLVEASWQKPILWMEVVAMQEETDKEKSI